MGHVVLLGDSIFDNARYVPDRPAVIDQVRQALPRDWRATLFAIDGSMTEDVVRQLRSLPADTTHVVVSAGGNDALSESSVLGEAACTVGDALGIIHEVRSRFADAYRKMLQALAIRKPTAVCTVYDAIPGLGVAEKKTALAGFNEVILREAFQAGLPVIDLRLVCTQAGDYSHVSAIEPSAVGGAKIARVIAELATAHDFGSGRSVIYV